MRKRTVILLGVLALLALYWIGSREQDATPAASVQTATPTPAATWQPLLELSGSGIKQSESFRNAGREVRLSWESNAERAGLSIFQIYVHRASDDGLVQVAANTTAEGGESTIVRLTPGEYYLKVNAVTKWAVKAEEKR
jgi:hypothetical protein